MSLVDLSEYQVNQKVIAKYDLGDNEARGRKAHIFANKGETLLIRELDANNMTHPLRVSRPKNRELIFGIHPSEIEIKA